jgi:hypothetical protein
MEKENRFFLKIFAGLCNHKISVPDPKQDPHVFGPPGSVTESISQRYGSGSGSFYQQAKIVRKTLILTVL